MLSGRAPEIAELNPNSLTPTATGTRSLPTVYVRRCDAGLPVEGRSGMTSATRVSRAVALLAVLAVVACAALAYPYLSLAPADSRVPIVDEDYWVVLIGHIATAAVALVLVPVQILLGDWDVAARTA